MSNPDRRSFFRRSIPLVPATLIGASGAAVLADQAASAFLPATPGPAVDIRAENATTYSPTFFNADEYRFLQAAVARLIPADDRGPGALEAGVPEFIDRQMQTAYGSGALWYMQGPFMTDLPREMGYQLKLPPRDIYRLGIAAADRWCAGKLGKRFAELAAAEQDQALTALEKGAEGFDAMPSGTFFSMLLTNTREGFFSDPLHGGNKDMVGWKLIGFPGARADFMDWIERDEKYPLPPVSIHGVRAKV
ncbi:gluconate 2-dehydrogenase subunit 3 family protein [Xylophilus sp. GOD-11R]|uniref:gluconate 2-dehydrogenase subunit 3 family protein n=1 Tax=Xylophilus sp. GOD-11R TaxID=3089814 RepID=UPI0039999ACB